MNLKNKPMKELNLYTAQIMKTYQKAKIDTIITSEISGTTKYLIRLDQTKVKSLTALEYIKVIDAIIDTLPEDQRYIFRELYINKPLNPLWYEDHLSRATYYRQKRQALENFLMHF